MTTKTMAEVIRAHQPTTGMSVASGVTCKCGYWNGNERGGVDRPIGFQGLIWHQSQELEAAGLGLVTDDKRTLQHAALMAYDAVEEGALREAGAKALEEAADGADSLGLTLIPVDSLRTRAADMRKL